MISLTLYWPELGHVVTLSCKGVWEGELFLAHLEAASKKEEGCDWLLGGQLKTSF